MELSLLEIKPILKYIIENNQRLEEQGKHPVGINLVGEAGIGKSEVVEDIAKELNYNFVKLNLAQISETGDLCGFPMKLHYVCKGDNCTWISSELLDVYVKNGYVATDETKMAYALPEWYKNIDESKPLMLVLDDATRALSNILQSVYELIYKQELWSFKLPPKSTVILTSNPEGDYNVTSVDEAFASRVINFNLKWSIDSWSKWAEQNQIDSRCINFLLSYHNEFMDPKDTHTHIMNARSYTMFANTISGISNWSTAENLAFILQIASGCFNDKNNIVGSLFTTFIANKLDKLITPEDLLLKQWDTVKQKLKSCVYDSNNDYKPHIASILHTRLLNYCEYYFERVKGAKTDKVEERLLQLIDAPEKDGVMLFSEDFLFNIINNLIKKFPTRTNKLVLNPKIIKRIL